MADYNSSLTGDQIEQTLLGAVLSNKNQLLTEEQKAQARKNIGAGTSDSGLKLLGYYDTADQLEASATNPKAGDAYAVGTEAPYDIYIWDAVHRTWVNNGNIRGADGKDADLSDAEPMKHKFTDVRIAPAAYVDDETYPDFPFRAAIPLEGINETMTPCVTFDVVEAIGGMFAPVAECYNGGVYIYAESAPNYEIIIPTIICWEGVYAVDDPAAEKLILGYNDLRVLIQPEVDAAGEAAAQAHTYAEQAKEYAEQAQAGAEIANGSITADKIAAGAVTRAKLATDALYSPIGYIGADRNISATDLGKTLFAQYSSTGTDLTLTLSQDTSTTLPNGFEFAVGHFYANNKIKVALSGVRAVVAGEGTIGGKSKTVTVRPSEVGQMIAFKRIDKAATVGDMWVITGAVEVEA